MAHKLHCSLNNQFSALENWVQEKGREPETAQENLEIILMAQSYGEWNCRCDRPYVPGTRL